MKNSINITKREIDTIKASAEAVRLNIMGRIWSAIIVLLLLVVVLVLVYHII